MPFDIFVNRMPQPISIYYDGTCNQKRFTGIEEQIYKIVKGKNFILNRLS